MTISPLQRRLRAARAVISGDFSSTSRVVDTLLDLRQIADDEPTTVALVDSYLAALPGPSVVTNEWWRDALDELDRAAGDSAPLTSVAG
ncbi:MAG: hypothetical protein AAGK32_19715 [Actinomycetota bacterium]